MDEYERGYVDGYADALYKVKDKIQEYICDLLCVIDSTDNWHETEVLSDVVNDLNRMFGNGW